MTGKNNLSDIYSLHGSQTCSIRSQAATGMIPYLSKFRDLILTALYRYFDKSAQRSQSLKEFQKIFERCRVEDQGAKRYQVVLILRSSGGTEPHLVVSCGLYGIPPKQ